MNTRPEGDMTPRKGWWGRNWPWVIPVGCLGMLLSCGCLGAIIFGITFKALSNSIPYAEAMSRAQASPEVRTALGEPIESTSFPQGSVQMNSGQGSANLLIPLKGSKAEGTLFVEGYKDGERWQYTTLEVQVPDQEPIDLLGGSPQPPAGTRPSPDALPDVEPLPEDEESPPAPKEDIPL